MQSINPATGEPIARYPDHSPEEIQQRLGAAERAFVGWREMPLAARSQLFHRLAGSFRQSRDSVSRLMTIEMGKPITASEGEVEKCAGACEYFADHAGEFLAPRAIASDASESFVRFDPIGPILAIMPWNFPLWQVIRFAAPALMAGNVGLLKHAPNVPGCAIALEKLFAESGFPDGVFSALLISDNTAAENLISHPAVRAVTLTGSERAGRAVASTAGHALKKTVMELGGSDPFIVLADADIATVAARAAESRCINNGQSCIAAKRFIVERAILGEFEAAFVAAMAGMKIGDPMDPATQIGPLARLDLLETLHDQVRRSIAQGAKLKLGGKRRGDKGYFYEPTVLSEVFPNMAVFDEETFGPVAAIVSAGSADEAVDLANASRYGLGASIWSNNPQKARSLAGRIESGSVFINGIVKSDARLPFGGVKNSGWGRELGCFGIHEFVNIKTVWVK
jgi:succinate-semialdehyde dehydrogenase / glutarate-semialdehyde dehydrogenase